MDKNTHFSHMILSSDDVNSYNMCSNLTDHETNSYISVVYTVDMKLQLILTIQGLLIPFILSPRSDFFSLLVCDRVKINVLYKERFYSQLKRDISKLCITYLITFEHLIATRPTTLQQDLLYYQLSLSDKSQLAYSTDTPTTNQLLLSITIKID